MKPLVKHTVATALALAGLAAATQAVADITFYEQRDFGGESVNARNSLPDMDGSDFDNRASSVIVTGSRWEVCDEARFRGQCVVLRPGQYASLGAMGLNNRISSARAVATNARIADDRYAPMPVVSNDYRRRGREQLYDADVVAVRAVVSTPQQRCWVEKQEVAVERSNAVPGGIAGAVIGGILGHQIGGGSGRTIATVGGALGGAAVGTRVGANHGSSSTRTQDVQRCETAQVQNSRPEYWDVTYTFRGQTHTAQMTAPPGATIKVDNQGVPRA